MENDKILHDGGRNGRLYLGLFYYLTNHRAESIEILGKSCDLGTDNWKLVPFLLMPEPNRFKTFPSFLENDKILHDLFEKWHLHGGARIDPLFLRVYLVHQITNGRSDLTKYLKLDSNICDSEASNYMRYRLGLFPEGSDEFTKYSEEKECVYRCSLFASFSK